MRIVASSLVLSAVVITILLLSYAVAKNQDCPRRRVYTSADDICPVLVGTKIPAVSLQDIDGNTVDLQKIITESPTVLVFYRGGWCPFCNTQLGQLQQIEGDVLKAGFRIIAISPDRPAELRKSINKQKLNYTLLSDSTADAIKAFGIAFRVDEATLTKYKGYGVDLEKSSGHNHHILPVPAVFVVNTEGVINFAYANPDYKTRLDPALLLAAVKSAPEGNPPKKRTAN